MATYISAILRCDVVDVNDPRIRQLENVTSWGAQEVARLRRDDYPDVVLGPRGWVRTDDVFPIPVSRPSVLTPDVALRTDEDFYFHFGHGAVQVVCSLRWGTFLQDRRWRRPVIAACLDYADVLGASDGVLSGDESSLGVAFEDGHSFDEILQEAKGKDNEVTTIDEMLEILDDGTAWDSHGYWYFLRYGQPVPIDD